MNNIYLCGFMGTGKTTVGKTLAKRRGVCFLDTDDIIVETCGMPIPEIFRRYGEEHFRRQETAALQKTGENHGAVVSTGGGIVLNSNNVMLMKELGTLVFLDTPFDLCYHRIKGDKNRPNAVSRTKAELLELYQSRVAFYREASDLIIPCGNQLQPVIHDLMGRL